MQDKNKNEWEYCYKKKWVDDHIKLKKKSRLLILLLKEDQNYNIQETLLSVSFTQRAGEASAGGDVCGDEVGAETFGQTQPAAGL